MIARITFLLTIALLIAACKSYDNAHVPAASAQSAEVAQRAALMNQQALYTDKVPVSKAEESAETQLPVPFDRKIIRNGELTLELADPAAAQRKISTIAESFGGFVVTSESRQSASDVQKTRLSVDIVVRVPAARFGETLNQIRATGASVLQEKTTGQDVTEEFIDLAARIKTKKALEAQFMEIMKRATKISDALEVQSQIAEVRGEIERLEGRKRFLENQSALSTITVHLQTPAPLLASAPGGFWRSVSEAFGDGLTGATEIILSVIRVVVVLIPIVLFIVLPVWLLWHFALRRLASGWFRKPETIVPSSEA